MHIKLLPSQEKFLSVGNEPKYAFCAAIGTGKTFASGLWLVLRGIKYRESSLVASQTWSSTETVQFKQVTEILDGLHYGYTFNTSKLILTLDNGAIIRGGSSQSPNAVTGATRYHNLLTDESAIFDDDSRKYLAGRCRGVDSEGKLIEPKYRYIGSPPLPGHTGWYDSFLRRHPELSIFASMEEAVGKTLSQQYFEEQIEIYGGRESPICQAQVFGKLMPDDVNDFCVFYDTKPGQPRDVSLGADLSGAGRDYNVFVVCDGERVLEVRKIRRSDTFTLCNTVRSLVERWGVKRIRLDGTGGFAQGIFDILSVEYDFVESVNFGEKAYDSEHFANARAEMYFNLAHNLPEGITDEMREEMKVTSWIINRSGKTQLIEKDVIKKLLGRSPDALDALALACYDCAPVIEKVSHSDLQDIMAAFSV